MKNIWIIGGSEGIGLAVARKLQSDGGWVTISARNEKRLKELKRKHDFDILPMDATDADQVSSAIEYRFRHGDSRPDTVLINIGDYEPATLDNVTVDVFTRLNQTNFLAPMQLLLHLLPRMRDTGGGTIWVNASLAAYRGLPKSAPYSASKAAVLSMVESMRLEAQAWGVRLGIINHGFVRTRLTKKNAFDMPGMIEPQEAAEHIVSGMHKDSFEITFPGFFSLWFKLLRCMPYRLYFSLTKRML